MGPGGQSMNHKTFGNMGHPNDPLRVLAFFVKKSSTGKWMSRRILEFPWISEVPSNPQLTLDKAMKLT